jgi:hypothetical protein
MYRLDYTSISMEIDLNHCVTEEHYYLRKNAMSTVGFYPRTSHIVSHHSTNRAQAISRDAMNRLCIRYNVGICKVAFPLHVVNRYANKAALYMPH